MLCYSQNQVVLSSLVAGLGSAWVNTWCVWLLASQLVNWRILNVSGLIPLLPPFRIDRIYYAPNGLARLGPPTDLVTRKQALTTSSSHHHRKKHTQTHTQKRARFKQETVPGELHLNKKGSSVIEMIKGILRIWVVISAIKMLQQLTVC